MKPRLITAVGRERISAVVEYLAELPDAEYHHPGAIIAVATARQAADMLESFLSQVDDIPATEKATDAQ